MVVSNGVVAVEIVSRGQFSIPFKLKPDENSLFLNFFPKNTKFRSRIFLILPNFRDKLEILSICQNFAAVC